MIAGRNYRSCRTYERLAEDLIEDEPSLEPLLTKPLANQPKKKQKAFLETIRSRINGHTISSLAVSLGHVRDATSNGTNNPAGINGETALPLSPAEKRQQLEFAAMTSWFGSTENEKVKVGSPAHTLFREVGLITTPDGKPFEPAWPNLPRTSLEQLAPAIDKLAKDMKSKLREAQ